ncbi:ferredoxin [Nocardia goodfellowii]|uniref:Ferredoxin n=1 Tax=Nocardia goodfellowii TaxID=882446 RepID=A0ABS4QFQ5_9NOCA|nr:ferredoxin [Nocardia goodfellowii]MBP2190518.1 ferredoxin [Nocardia goodfellowii]
MRISANYERCIGAGMCALLAPDVFDQDEDDGRVRVSGARPQGSDSAVREAVEACPSGALTIIE